MTNLTLDEDVAAALASEAERRGVPADRLANDELRARFCTDLSDRQTPFEVKTFASGYQPGIDPERLKELLYEEDEQRYRHLSRQLEE